MHYISSTTILPRETIRGVTAGFSDLLETDQLAEVPIMQYAQSPPGWIVSSVPGRAHPILLYQILFHIPNTTTYINLASAEQLSANIMASQNGPWGELPLVGDIPITTTILLKMEDTYPSGFNYTLCIKRVSTFNSISYCYAIFSPDHQRTSIGLIHTGLLVQAGQLAGLGWILAWDH